MRFLLPRFFVCPHINTVNQGMPVCFKVLNPTPKGIGPIFATYSSVTIQGSKHFALYINCQSIFRPKPRLITPLLSAI